MAELILIEGGREVVVPARAAGLPPIFAECCNPAVPLRIDPRLGLYDLRSPWRDGPVAWATDGAIVCWVAEKHVPPTTFAAIRPADATVPRDIAGSIQKSGPFEPKALALPSIFAVPDATRLPCRACAGSGFLAAPGLPPCPACGATRRDPRAGVGVALIEPTPGFPPLGLDAWYLTLLRWHRAVINAPILDPRKPGRVGPFRFQIGPVTGLVQPSILPRIPGRG